MTSDEWATCTDPTAMLQYMNDRQLRLFSASCWYDVWGLLPPKAQYLIRIAERYADGLADDQERVMAMKALLAVNRADFDALAPKHEITDHFRSLAGVQVGYSNDEREGPYVVTPAPRRFRRIPWETARGIARYTARVAGRDQEYTPVRLGRRCSAG
jgi:hypothetical protein